MLDIRSDTVTKPSAAMRQAMAAAEVGDDVLDGDPTVSRLEARVAHMLGKEAGLFFPTGSMANMTGLAVHAALGSEALLDEDAHIIHGEMAGAAALLGVQVRLVRVGEGRTVMNADDLRRAIRAPSKHDPAISVICLENTHNGAGGKVTSVEDMRAMREVAREHEIPVHMDGARLWNASATTGTSLADFGDCADTVMLSFSKGLGCPVGAILVGSAAGMKRAHAVRKRFGGGMRQSGILAAAVLYALDANLDRLPQDHANARLFADAVAGANGASVVPPDSNIVMIDLADGVSSAAVVARAEQGGVRISEWNPTRVRAVAHLDVNAADMARAAEVVRGAIEECAAEAVR
ncbi:MAG: threonine aldolase [Gemmatimonadetes bacterium]|jgi:threonine aldolase|nr:threonine aldolase [Gemmatimonadota bacterium]